MHQTFQLEFSGTHLCGARKKRTIDVHSELVEDNSKTFYRTLVNQANAQLYCERCYIEFPATHVKILNQAGNILAFNINLKDLLVT